MKKYKKKTQKVIEMLLSEDFKNKKLTQGEIFRTTKVSKEVIRYHKYRLYEPEKFSRRYKKLSTA